MKDSKKEDNFNASLMEKIKSGEIKMKTRAYFISKTIGFILVSILIFLLTIFLVSFIIFFVRGSGLWFLPGFGWRGVGIMLLHLPWFLIAFSAALLIVLEVLISHLGFAYRRPLIYSTLGLLVMATATSILISRTSLHVNAFRAAAQDKLPFAGLLYRSYGAAEGPEFVSGRVFAPPPGGPGPGAMEIVTANGETLEVELPTSTDIMMLNGGPISKDDMIMIMGDRNGTSIRAAGIRSLEKEEQDFFQDKGEMMLDQQQNNGASQGSAPMMFTPSSDN